jgi:hypothetical protein
MLCHRDLLQHLLHQQLQYKLKKHLQNIQYLQDIRRRRHHHQQNHHHRLHQQQLNIQRL